MKNYNETLARLEKLDAERSSGLWEAYIGKCGRTFDVHVKGKLKDTIVFWTGFDSSGRALFKQESNARFLAAAPTMMQVIRDQQEVIERLKGALGEMLSRSKNFGHTGFPSYSAYQAFVDVHLEAKELLEGLVENRGTSATCDMLPTSLSVARQTLAAIEAGKE